MMYGINSSPDSAAREWIERHVQTEPYQWMGDVLWGEPRNMWGVVQGMLEEGIDDFDVLND
jgi:hypothetical protein